MARRLLCEACREQYTAGRYELLAAGPDGPAEWVRVVAGRAKAPTIEQRTIRINGVPYPPSAEDLTHYACDHCNSNIRPGDPAWAVTIWIPRDHTEPPAWESAYLTPLEE